MTPALQPQSPRPRPRRRRSSRAATAPRATSPSHQGQALPTPIATARSSPSQPPAPKVKALRPHRPADPRWLQSLTALQHTSAAIAFLIGGVAIGFYASTVHAQQQWGRTYRQLENLQRQETQLTAAHEMLRQQLAQEAELPQSGLVPPSSDTVLFLEPADPRPAPPPPQDPPLSNYSYPIGY